MSPFLLTGEDFGFFANGRQLPGASRQLLVLANAYCSSESCAAELLSAGIADGKVPSVFSWIGMGSSKKGTTSGLHTPKLKIDDDALPLGRLACPPASCMPHAHWQ